MEEVRQKATEKLIRNVSRFMDKDAKDIMTHRRDIVAVDEESTLDETLRFMLQEKYSRYPIYRGDIDEIVGFMHLREAMTCYLSESLRNIKIKELKEYIRPVKFIPETRSIDRIFKEMQADKSHIVIVIDEYGQTAGLVALEDILEELVGNIEDEHDNEDELIESLPDGTYIVSGRMELEKLSDILPIEFETEEYETLNGFMIDQLDRIPDDDEEGIIEYQNYRFTVLEANDKTIQRVKIEKVA